MVSDNIYDRQNDTVEKKITLKSVVNTFWGGADSYLSTQWNLMKKTGGARSDENISSAR